MEGEFRDVDSLRLLDSISTKKNVLNSLWIAYQGLYDRVLDTRSHFPDKSGLQLTTRRLIVAQIISSQKQKVVENEREEEGKLLVISILLESLVLMSMDVVPSLMLPSVKYPLIMGEGISPKQSPEGYRLILPSNESGTSCFCDSVLVSMFVSTTGFDIIFSEDVEPFSIQLWEEQDLLKNTVHEVKSSSYSWIENMFPQIETSACFLAQEKKYRRTVFDIREEQLHSLVTNVTKDLVKKMTKEDLGKGIIKEMRRFGDINTGQYTARSRKLGKNIASFREKLGEECEKGERGPTGELQQDDPVEFFRSILEVTGMESVFSTFNRKTRIDVFYESGSKTLIDGVKPWTRIIIGQPDIISFPIPITLPSLLSPPPPPRSIQDVIDSYFSRIELSSERKHKVEDDDNTFDRYILEQNPDLILRVLGGQDLIIDIETTQTTNLFKIPDPLVFSLARISPGLDPTFDQKIKTPITMPLGEIITFPIMEYFMRGSDEEKHRIPYRITAIVCHIGAVAATGHYTMYFRYGGQGDDWYHYNDSNPITSLGTEIDIHDPRRVEKNIIEQNAYFFVATRVNL